MALINPETLAQLSSTLSEISGADVAGENIEVEARFGKFVESIDKAGRLITNFVSGVDRRVFVRIRDFASRIKPEHDYLHSKDFVYRDFSDRETTERFTKVYDNNGLPTQTFRTVKTRIKNFDFPEYAFRISISRELSDNEPEPQSQQQPQQQPIHVRQKKRWSYLLNNNQFRLDLTEVTTFAGDRETAETVFEVEIEILSPKIQNLNNFDSIITIILRQVLGTHLLYTQTEKSGLIDRINKYLGSRTSLPDVIDNRVLAQARNLKARDMVKGGLVPKTNRDIQYSVTIKADGVRKLLVIDPHGIYLVMAPNDVMKILSARTSQQLEDWYGAVIEGELIPKENIVLEADQRFRSATIIFYMYDILSSGHGGDPSIQQVDHLTRLGYIDKILPSFSKVNGLIFEKKVFERFSTVNNFYQKVNLVLDRSYPFKTDGIIFTPVNHRYDSSTSKMKLHQRKLANVPDIVKWKPIDQLTIDFEVRHIVSGEGSYVDLLSNADYKAREVNAILYPKGDLTSAGFVGSADYPFNPVTQVVINDLLRSSPNGAILEFGWDQTATPPVELKPSNLKILKAIKPRYDKTIANNYVVALDVYEDIHRPINEGTIRGSHFSLLFRYHNRVKSELFQQVGAALPVGTKTLLDIGSGKGGDVRKWIDAGFTHVICVEPSDENRTELNRRLAETKLIYLIVPTIGQDIATIIQAVRTFAPLKAVEAISYMLSLSFFFDNPQSSQSIIDLVNSTLMYGGYFTALTIDGRYVLEYFNKPENHTLINGIAQGNFQMIDFQLRPGNQIYINIPESIVQNQIEYITNIPGLQQAFDGIGLELISEERTNKEGFMTNEEIVFSQMFSSFIMKRRSPQ